MAANTSPLFTLVPIIGQARISTANTNRDGTGTLATLATGTTNGTRLDRVTIKATSTTTAGMIRFYIDDGASNVRLINEIAVTAATPSGTVVAFAYEVARTDSLPLLVLPTSYLLRVSTNNAESFDVLAYGGNY